MNEMTPGQAACIAWNAHYAEEHGIEARNEWAASDPRGRGAWEAAAKAAQAPLLDYLDDFTRAVIDLDAGRQGNFAAAARSVRKKAGLRPVDAP